MSTQTSARRAVAIQITHADEHRRAIGRSGSSASCVQLVKKYYQTAQARGMDYIEARFWLGASIAQSQLVSKHGEGVVERLAADTGISKPFLYESLKFFDTFGGRFDRMYDWSIGWVNDHGSLLASDVKQLVSANRDRSDLAREVRRHNGATGDKMTLEETNPPKVRRPGPAEPPRKLPTEVYNTIREVTRLGKQNRELVFMCGDQHYELSIRRVS